MAALAPQVDQKMVVFSGILLLRLVSATNQSAPGLLGARGTRKYVVPYGPLACSTDRCYCQTVLHGA